MSQDRTAARVRPLAPPQPRRLSFDLPPERAGDWNANGRQASHFFNALSLFFPHGERYFIDAVRHYRDRPEAAELAQAVRGFIGQEALHGRAHSQYNDLLAAHGLPARRLERLVADALDLQRALLPPAMRLSATIALEHFTAILADRLLGDPRLLDGAEPGFAAVWRWHAIEETEHKAVAFDVWEHTQGCGLDAYLVRGAGMLASTAVFCIGVAAFTLVLSEADATARRDRRGYLALLRLLFGGGGLVSGGLRHWQDYFRRSFHPWDHDNRRLLSVDAAAELSLGAAA